MPESRLARTPDERISVRFLRQFDIMADQLPVRQDWIRVRGGNVLLERSGTKAVLSLPCGCRREHEYSTGNGADFSCDAHARDEGRELSLVEREIDAMGFRFR